MNCDRWDYFINKENKVLFDDQNQDANNWGVDDESESCFDDLEGTQTH